jgi:predicted CXXCH cytochrome family protein
MRNAAVFLLAAVAAARLASAGEVMPNSSRECAICHVRWVEAFDRNEARTVPMQAAMERQAGSGDMCLSCHDGSVTDSRFKVWSTRHHATDVVPSPAVHIPTDRFPLDAQGRMTCATCHTAHAVPGNSDLRTVIFLRQPNVDSSLCLACHPQHAQKNDCQHPLGQSKSPVPKEILEAGGKTSADGHAIFCQTCHEPHGAKNVWMLVLPPSELCVACHTEKAPEVSPPAGAPAHRIGHTYAGFQPPATLLKEKATFGPGGELSCLSCHRLHDASGAKPLLIRKNQDSSLCLECHEKEKAVLGSPHDLRVSSPDTANVLGEKSSVSGPCGACHRVHGWARDVPETNRPHSSGCMECHGPSGPGSHNRPYVEAHPVGVAMPEGKSVALPLDQATQAVGCLTCHDPHAGRPVARGPTSEGVAGSGTPNATSRVWEPSLLSVLGEEKDATANQQPTTDDRRPATDFQFLRREGSQLCVLCHDTMTDSLQGPHDPARFTPSVRKTLGVPLATGSCRVCHTAHNARGPHLWARTPANSTNGAVSNLCDACHDGDSVKEPQGTHHPLTPDASHRPEVVKTNPMSPVQPAPEISCIRCHDAHSDARSAAQLRGHPDSLCTTCHEDKQQIRGSVHDPGANAWGKNLGLVSKGLCLDCHPIHGPRKQTGVWRSLGGERTPENLCEACHRPGKPGKAMGTPHVGKASSNEPGNQMGGLPMGPDKQILCATCHDIHQNEQNPKLLRAARCDSTLCITCHAEFDGVLDTPHDLRKSAPAARNVQGEPATESGPCGSCHLVHPTFTGAPAWAQGVGPGGNAGKGLCTCCHSQGNCAQTRVPQYADHPEVALLNRLSPGDPDYMPTCDDRGRPSPTGTISCPTCHQVHAIRAGRAAGDKTPPSHPMLLRTTHQTLCADCHGAQAPWRFLYYHKADRNPQREPAANAPALEAENKKDSPPGL